jgi:hypothetical protein
MSKVEELTDEMKKIYDADRDYEICLADLPTRKQEKYAALKAQRDALLK